MASLGVGKLNLSTAWRGDSSGVYQHDRLGFLMRWAQAAQCQGPGEFFPAKDALSALARAVLHSNDEAPWLAAPAEHRFCSRPFTFEKG